MHPVLLKFGPLTLYSYGAMIALGFLAAVSMLGRRAGRVGLDPAQVQNVALVGLVGGILGARLAYVALNWDLYRSDWQEMIRLDHGGLVFYGGFVAGLLAMVGMIRRYRMPLGSTVDLLVPAGVLAHAFGRIGCFLNGCCYGKPSSVPWAVAFPADGIPRHPTQLYEALFLLALFFWLSKPGSGTGKMSLRAQRSNLGFKNEIASGAAHPRNDGYVPGTVLFRYGLVYGLWRFAVEFLRGDNPTALAGLTLFQLASAGLALVSGMLLLRSRWGQTPRRGV